MSWKWLTRFIPLLEQPGEKERRIFEFFRTEAEKGNAQTQFILASRYAEGKGVAKDMVEAVKWYRKAAEQNFRKAQRELGFCYNRGDGVPMDKVEGAKWLSRAAEQENDIDVKFFAITTKDDVEAVKCWRQVAAHNDASAQDQLGMCYRTGRGVERDYVSAVKWFREAAEQDYADAQRHLGECYAWGQGVPMDYVVAIKWLILASAHRSDHFYDPSERILSQIKEQMIGKQIAEAERLAHEFKPKKLLVG